MVHKDAFEYTKPLQWKEVFDIWRVNEDGEQIGVQNWPKHWREHGFTSWEEWRTPYAEAFGAPQKEWRLYRIKEPSVAIPQFRGGPFKSWADNFYQDKEMPRFAELVQNPAVAQHPYVLQLLNDFPKETTISGLVLPNQDIVAIEGMHRCCAVALTAHWQKPLSATVFIALAEHERQELPTVGGFRK